jgi:hypothetical protein
MNGHVFLSSHADSFRPRQPGEILVQVNNESHYLSPGEFPVLDRMNEYSRARQQLDPASPQGRTTLLPDVELDRQSVDEALALADEALDWLSN